MKIAQIEYTAICYWLIRQEELNLNPPMFMKPKEYSYPFSLYFHYEPEAILSKKLFEMIEAFCNHVNKSNENDYTENPAFYWLLSMAAECRKKMSQPDYDQTKNSVYLTASKLREWALNLETAKSSFSEIDDSLSENVRTEELQALPQQLMFFDRHLFEACKTIAVRDREFQTVWKNYWQAHKEFYSRHVKKKKEAHPVTLESKNPNKRLPREP